jgi:high-affinity iron transporter
MGAGVVAAWAAAPDPTRALPGPEELLEAQRAVGLIEYVASDYALAVGADGTVLEAEEWEEQHEILIEVRAILTAGRPRAREAAPVAANRLERHLAGAERLVLRHARPADLQHVLRALRQEVIERYGLRLAPVELPDLAHGRALYRQACTACHGNEGRGKTPLTARLEPAPPDFLNERFDRTLSPAHVFNVLTFGIPGTPMPAFAPLTERERWDLAFYVVALRHEAAETVSPCIPTRKLTFTFPAQPGPAELAGLSDVELKQHLRRAGVPDECLHAACSRLRRRLSP